MYAAELDGRDGRLNFLVSGMLWNRSLVMEDEETGSLWSHILGRAMQGELEGRKLDVIPSALTDWASWSKRHPAGAVVKFERTAKRFTRAFQEAHSKHVLGLELDGQARAYPYDLLAKKGVVNDEAGGSPIVVVYDPAGACASAFSRRLPGGRAEVASFTPLPDGRMRDGVWGATWDRQAGVVISGRHKGEELERLPGIPSYRRAWQQFHPDSQFYAGE